jgi:hypothetical protein
MNTSRVQCPSSVRTKWDCFRKDDCPVCSKRGWCSETRKSDGSRIVQCMHEHDPSRPDFLNTKPNRSGEQASYYLLDPGAPGIGVKPSPNGNGKHKPVEPADEKTRHAVYTALSQTLGLSAVHHAALVARGLSDDDIERGKFATLPTEDRGKIAMAVLALVKADGIKAGQLRGVPGFIKRDDVPLALAGRAGLLIPVMDAAGTIGGMVLRPDKPALDPQGKPLGKYVWLTSSTCGGPGAVCSAHVSPGVSLPIETVRLTEGPLKAAVAQSKSGLPTIGLPGVGSWRLGLLALKPLSAKRVRLAFDADAAGNPNVAGALARAVRGLVAAGYAVEVEQWDSTHKGIDDALAAGVTTEVLVGLDAVRFALDQARRIGAEPCVELDEVLAWVRWYLDRGEPKALFADGEVLDGTKRLRDRDPVEFASVETLLRKCKLWTAYNGAVKSKTEQQKKAAASAAPDVPYTERAGCTYAVFSDGEGNVSEKKIAGFTARITREIIRHEAGETCRHFEIKATLADGTAAAATIKADDFEALAWVAGKLGSNFKVEPGRGTRDLMRHAIQTLSHHEKAVEFLDVYTSLGWHTINGELVYLHAGGGIGAAGPVAVHVETVKELAVYRLPAPDETRFAQSVERVLMLHDLLGDEAVASVAVTLPCLAVLGPVRFVVHFSGTTGTRKTSVAILVVRFFAPGLERTDTMPATWSTTANGLQRAQHDAGDLVLLVDNLIADGDQAARELFKADMVFNSQGDLGGRRRMRTDGTLAPALDPRGCLLSTGEVDPQRRSALGRSLIVEFEPGKFSDATLDRCHAAARDGHYAATIATYIKHLAAPGKLDEARQALRQIAIREQAHANSKCDDCHPRQAEAVAELVAAWSLFLDFAVEQGALARDRADKHVKTVRGSLIGLLAAQASIQHESDAGEMFLELVRSLLASKRAVLSATDGDMPPVEIAGACGWVEVVINTKTGLERNWELAQGAARIGWVDETHVYLDAATAHAAAERLARETRQVLGIQRQILSRLAETNRLVLDPDTPGTRRRFTRRATIEKSRRWVIQMLRDEVLELDPQAKTAQDQQATQASEGPLF